MTSKTLSTVAWQQIRPIYLDIMRHRFNQELLDGSLPPVKFRRFLKQDVYYLRNLARCLGIIGRKVHSQNYFFLSYEDDGFKEELDYIHCYFLQNNFSYPTDTVCLAATRDYSDYQLRTAACEPVEVAIASVLPCFLFFRELGIWMNANMTSTQNHPYIRWINTYSSKNFCDSVDHIIEIFDEVAFFTSDEIRQRMLMACKKSARFEWRFVNEIENPPGCSLNLFKDMTATACPFPVGASKSLPDCRI